MSSTYWSISIPEEYKPAPEPCNLIELITRMSPIKLGFVGLSARGWAATTLAQPLFEEPLSSKYILTAVSTTNPTSANASAEKYNKVVSGIAKPYHGFTEQTANDPNMLLYQAKKNLFIEWPAGSLLADKKGARTLVGFQTRQAAYVRKVKEILEPGALGRILATFLTDTHQITFGGQFANKDGTVLSVNTRNVLTEHGAGLFWVIDGEKGTIKIRADGMKGQSFMRAQPELWLNGEKVDVVTDREAERCARHWNKFAEGAEGEYTTMEDAVQAKKVVDAIFKSSNEGRRVDL
ncbi:transcription regulator gal80 [Paramarasmius palmivorus]|uniref:Transcription regulator gal80 n=1 Tax=Paramarasmius palmivorus TaxID=297713 RepID=A0AAW0B6W8_9AGAR